MKISETMRVPFNRWKQRLVRLRSFPWRIIVLLLISYPLTGLVRMAILLVPFKHLSKILGSKGGNTPEETDRIELRRAARVGWVVETVSRFTLWESKCLVKAITAQLILRFVSIPTTLYLGVAKDEANKLIAHAWLRCGGLILTGANERDGFRTVAQFASLQRK